MPRESPDAADGPNSAACSAGDPDDLVGVMRVLDGALLEAEASAVRERLAAGDVLVAEAEGRVVGALVLAPVAGDDSAGDADAATGARIDAVAVRRHRRRSGTGTALVGAALAREGRLTAEFDPRVRGFYEALGFDIEARGDRLRGVREADGEEGVSAAGDADEADGTPADEGDLTRSR